MPKAPKNRPYFYFDLETNGLINRDNFPAESPIIRRAMGKLGGSDSDIFDVTANLPKGVLQNPEAKAVHGLNARNIPGAVSEKQLLTDLSNQLNSLPKNTQLVTFNGSTFDIKLAIARLNEHGLPIPPILKAKDNYDALSVEVVRSLALGIDVPKGYNTLESTYERYTGQKMPGAHKFGDIVGLEAVHQAQLASAPQRQTQSAATPSEMPIPQKIDPLTSVLKTADSQRIEQGRKNAQGLLNSLNPTKGDANWTNKLLDTESGIDYLFTHKSGKSIAMQIRNVAEGVFSDIMAVGPPTEGGQNLTYPESLTITPGGTTSTTSLQNIALDLNEAAANAIKYKRSLTEQYQKTASENTESTSRAVYDLYNTNPKANVAIAQQISVIARNADNERVDKFEAEAIIQDQLVPYLIKPSKEVLNERSGQTYEALAGFVWDSRIGKLRRVNPDEGATRINAQGEVEVSVNRTIGKTVSKPTLESGTMDADPMNIVNGLVVPVKPEPVRRGGVPWAVGNVEGRKGVRQVQAFENTGPGSVLDVGTMEQAGDFYSIPGILKAELPNEDIREQAAKLSIRGKVQGKVLHQGRSNVSPIFYKGESVEFTEDQREDAVTRDSPHATTSKGGIVTGLFARIPAFRNNKGEGVLPEYYSSGKLKKGIYSNEDQLSAFREALGEDADVTLDPYALRTTIGLREAKIESTKGRGAIKQGTVRPKNTRLQAFLNGDPYDAGITHVGAEVKTGRVAENMISAQPVAGLQFLTSEWAGITGKEADKKFAEWVGQTYTEDREGGQDISADKWRSKYREFDPEYQGTGVELMQDILKPIVYLDKTLGLNTPEGQERNRRYVEGAEMGWFGLQIQTQTDLDQQKYTFETHIQALMDNDPKMTREQAAQIASQRSGTFEENGKLWEQTLTDASFVAPVMVERVAEFSGPGTLNAQAMRALHSKMPKLADALGFNPTIPQNDSLLKRAWQDATAVNIANTSRAAGEEYTPQDAHEMTQEEAMKIESITATGAKSFSEQVRQIVGGGLVTGAGVVSMGADSIDALQHSPLGEEVSGIGRMYEKAMREHAALVSGTLPEEQSAENAGGIARFGNYLAKIASKKGAISRALGAREVKTGGFTNYITAKGLETSEAYITPSLVDQVLEQMEFKSGEEFDTAKAKLTKAMEDRELPGFGIRSPQVTGEEAIIPLQFVDNEAANVDPADIENKKHLYISPEVNRQVIGDEDLDKMTWALGIKKVKGENGAIDTVEILKGTELDEFIEGYDSKAVNAAYKNIMPESTGMHKAVDAMYQMFKDVVKKVQPIQKVFENTGRSTIREAQEQLSGYNESKGAGMGQAFNEMLRMRQIHQRLRGVSEKEIQTKGMIGTTPPYQAMLDNMLTGSQQGGQSLIQLMSKAYVDSDEQTPGGQENKTYSVVKTNVYNKRGDKVIKAIEARFDADVFTSKGGSKGVKQFLNTLAGAATQASYNADNKAIYPIVDEFIAETFAINKEDEAELLTSLQGAKRNQKLGVLQEYFGANTPEDLAKSGAFVSSIANSVRKHLDPKSKRYKAVQGMLAKLPEQIRGDVLVHATAMNIETGMTNPSASALSALREALPLQEHKDALDAMFGPAMPKTVPIGTTPSTTVKPPSVVTTPGQTGLDFLAANPDFGKTSTEALAQHGLDAIERAEAASKAMAEYEDPGARVKQDPKDEKKVKDAKRTLRNISSGDSGGRKPPDEGGVDYVPEPGEDPRKFDKNGNRITRGYKSTISQQHSLDAASAFAQYAAPNIIGWRNQMEQVLTQAGFGAADVDDSMAARFGMAKGKDPELLAQIMRETNPALAGHIKIVGKWAKTNKMETALGLTGNISEESKGLIQKLATAGEGGTGLAMEQLSFAGEEGMITGKMGGSGTAKKALIDLGLAEEDIRKYNAALKEQSEWLEKSRDGTTKLTKADKERNYENEKYIALETNRRRTLYAEKQIAGYAEEERTGVYTTPNIAKKMESAQKDLARLQEQRGEIEEPPSKLGGFLRKALGGWGIMYAQRMWGMATQGTDYGAEEATQLGVATATSAGRLFGGGEVGYNQQQRLQNQMAITGSNYSAMMGAQQLLAENPILRDATSVSVAALSGYSFMQFLEMSGLEGAKKWAPATAAATGLANYLMTTYSKEQDPLSLGYRTVMKEGGATDRTAATFLTRPLKDMLPTIMGGIGGAIGMVAGFATGPLSPAAMAITTSGGVIAGQAGGRLIGAAMSDDTYLPSWLGGGTDEQRELFAKSTYNASMMEASLGTGQKTGDYFAGLDREAASIQYGMTVDEVLKAHPDLSKEAVIQAFEFSNNANLGYGIEEIAKMATDITLGRASTNIAMSTLATSGISATAALYNAPGQTSLAGSLAKQVEELNLSGERVAGILAGQEAAAQGIGTLTKYFTGAKQVARGQGGVGEPPLREPEKPGIPSFAQIAPIKPTQDMLTPPSPTEPTWAEKLWAEDEAYGRIAGTTTGTVYDSQAKLWYAQTAAGQDVGEMPQPSAYLGKEYTPEEAAILQSKDIGKMFALESRTTIADKFKNQAYAVGEEGLGDTMRSLFMNETKIPADQLQYFNKLFSMDPTTLADFSTRPGGAALSQQELPLITGGTLNARYLAGDMGVSGKQATGMPWGTTGITRPGMTAEQSAADIWGNDYATNPNLSQRIINASIGYKNPISGEMVGGEFGRAYENIQYQYDNTMAQIGVSMKSQAMQQAFTTGVGIGNYSGTINPQTGGTFGFNTGNFGFNIPGAGSFQSQGGGMWGLQDTSRNLGYAQQQWQFGQQQKQMDMSVSQFGENMGMNIRQSQMQRGWAQQDWAFNSNVRDLQWGWKQEDYQENVRFMTGRDRRLAERQQGRDVIMHDLEGEQIET